MKYFLPGRLLANLLKDPHRVIQDDDLIIFRYNNLKLSFKIYFEMS